MWSAVCLITGYVVSLAGSQAAHIVPDDSTKTNNTGNLQISIPLLLYRARQQRKSQIIVKFRFKKRLVSNLIVVIKSSQIYRRPKLKHLHKELTWTQSCQRKLLLQLLSTWKKRNKPINHLIICLLYTNVNSILELQ